MKTLILMLTLLLGSSYATAAKWVCEDSTVRFEFDTSAQSVFMEAQALQRKELEVSSFEQQEGCEPCLNVYADYVLSRFQHAYFHLVVDDERKMDGWVRGHPLLTWKKAYNDVPCTMMD